MSTFPVTRLRRLRRTGALRALVRETRLDLDDFVLPVFVAPEPLPNDALPALSRLTVDELVAEAEECASLGVSAPENARASSGVKATRRGPSSSRR